MSAVNSRRLLVALVVLVIGVWSARIFLWGDSGPHERPAVFSSLSLSAAVAQGKQDHKLVVVDAMATWCPPCRWMDQHTWVDESVVAWIGEHAIAVQVDVDRDGADAAELRIYEMPTLVVFRDGIEVGRTSGRMGASDLLAMLKAKV